MNRPQPGTHEEAIYLRLLPKVSMRGGIRCEEDFESVARLAVAIQRHGHANPMVEAFAEALGLDPCYLPHRRT